MKPRAERTNTHVRQMCPEWLIVTLNATRIVIGWIALIICGPVVVAAMVAVAIICIPFALLFLFGWIAKEAGIFIGGCMESALIWARSVGSADSSK